MDIGQIYHFLFETYAGIGCLVGAFLLITLLLAFLLERRTRRIYVDRPEPQDDDSDELGEDGDIC
ncbi:MAG: hypothetical protein Q4D34_00085 [Eggerthellaceae bacterium]|nr:hypothetical protein [Eggerthellaceae bacterium]